MKGDLEGGASRAVEQQNKERIQQVLREACGKVRSCCLVMGDP